MAIAKGMGACMINKADGTPCGMQIQEGEPIGTVMDNGPRVGHRSCADAFKFRAEQQTKEDSVVKIGHQDGPGGSVQGPDAFKQGLAFGSYDLEKKEVPDDDPVDKAVGGVVKGSVPEGVRPISEVPFDDPVDTWTAGRPTAVVPPTGVQASVEVGASWTSNSVIPTGPDLKKAIDNRFSYHQPTIDQGSTYVRIRETARGMAHLIAEVCPESEERDAAINALDHAVMLANASIARHG